MDALCDSLQWVAVALQLLGLLSVWMTRLTRTARLIRPGRYLFVSCLFGLGLTSALCSMAGSGLATITGGTVGVLLVAMVVETRSDDVPDMAA